jgi:hypothetical protein
MGNRKYAKFPHTTSFVRYNQILRAATMQSADIGVDEKMGCGIIAAAHFWLSPFEIAVKL